MEVGVRVLDTGSQAEKKKDGWNKEGSDNTQKGKENKGKKEGRNQDQ